MGDSGSTGREGSGPDPEDVTADVADFVADFLEDESEGRVPPLATYLRRFPRSEAAVAAEYLRLAGFVDVGSGSGAGTGGGAGSGPGTGAAGRNDAAEGGGQTPGDGARRVAHYRLIRRLGSGGQGEVWLALDETLQRRVALKLMTALFVTEERRARFRREAESIARMEHPGLAQVHDADIDGSPPYIAMRHVEGVDLGTSFTQGRAARSVERGETSITPLVPWMPTDRAELHAVLRFFERCARALHAAHEAGVLHRDVKPGNIMVTTAGDPVLLDFGLARGEELAADAALTREGEVFGTLAYMSPEQLRGETARVDARSDVWALGVTLYEALAGERPFQGRSPAELAIAIDTRPVPDLGASRAAITGDVQVVLETALDRSPERRYGSALDFAEDLRRIAEYEPIRARPAGPVLRFRRWCRREPAWAAALAVTLVALVGGLVASQLALDRMRSLLDSRTAQEYVAEIPGLNGTSPAAALALGLETVELEDTWRTRSALYRPLLDMTLRAWFRLPEARVWDVALPGTGDAVLAGDGGAVERVDVAAQRTLVRTSVGDDVRCLALDEGRGLVIAGTRDGRVEALRLGTLESVWSVEIASAPIVDLEVAGGTVVVLAAPGSVAALSTGDGTLLAERELEGGFGALEVTCDLQHVVVSPRKFHGARRVTGEVVVLRGEGLEPRGTFAHPLQVHDLALAESAALLATLDASGTARLFDLDAMAAVPDATGGQLGLPHRLGGSSIALSPDGTFLVVGLDSKDVEDVAGRETIVGYRLDALDREHAGAPQGRAARRLWSLRGGGRVVDLAFDPVRASGEGPRRARVAAASWDNRVRLLDAVTGAGLLDYREHNRPNDLAWSPDGEVLVSVGAAASAEVWRTRRSALAFRLADIDVSPQDGESGRHIGPTGGQTVAATVPASPAGGLVWGGFVADGERVVVLDDLGRAGLFDAPHAPASGTDADQGRSPGALLVRLDPAQGPAPGARVGVAAAAPVAAWVGPTGRMRALDTGGLGTLASAQASGFEPGSLFDLTLAEDGSALVCVDASATAWHWRIGQDPGPLTSEGLGPVIRACIDRAGSRVFLATADGRVARLALPPDGAQSRPRWFATAPAGPPSAPLTDLRLSPDGRRIVAALGRDRLVIWDTASGEIWREPSQRLRRERVVWLDDDRLLAIGTGGGSVQVIGPRGSLIPGDLHDRQLTSCAASRDGRVAATCSDGGVALVWDTRSGETLGRADVHGAPVRWIDVEGAGREVRVLTCSDAGAAIWPLDVLAAARRLTVRELMAYERRNLADLRLDGAE